MAGRRMDSAAPGAVSKPEGGPLILDGGQQYGDDRVRREVADPLKCSGRVGRFTRDQSDRVRGVL